MKRALIRIRARRRKEDRESLMARARSAIKRVAGMETHDEIVSLQVIMVAAVNVSSVCFPPQLFFLKFGCINNIRWSRNERGHNVIEVSGAEE